MIDIITDPTAEEIASPNKPLKIVIISSIFPKRCGIATFSRDLLNGISTNDPNIEILAVAAETDDEQYDYAFPIIAKIHTDIQESYARAGQIIAEAKPDIVLLQHEFGLYGGTIVKVKRGQNNISQPTGDYIFDLLALVNCPIITTLHTVMTLPDEARKGVINRLVEASKKVVTMTDDSKGILVRDYGVDPSKIAMIAHGVTKVENIPTDQAKQKLGLDISRPILMISGLIGENKSIDVAIDAMPMILAKHPKAQLYIVGQTHPNIIAYSGESYRDSLILQAKNLGISDSVVFVNHYLTLPELLAYLQCVDIYLTLHKDLEQAASGTLAYALGAGLASISTPYNYAKEVLSEGRGVLVDLDDSSQVAAAANKILGDHDYYQELRRKAYEFGASMDWPVIGQQYLNIITNG